MQFKILTENLILEVLTPDKADKVLDFYLNNEHDFIKYEPILGDNFHTLEYQRRVLDYEYKSALKLSMIRYHIYKKDDPDNIIGTICYHNIVKPIYASATVGYKIDINHRRQGYANEALRATLPILIEELGLHRIEALVMPDNIASIRLLEGLGFEPEGLLRDKIMIEGKWRDHIMYSLISN